MQAIKNWLESIGWGGASINVASADASFRSYYRVKHKNQIFILMDSSLEKESLDPFLDVAKRLEQTGVKVPKVYEQDLQEGYLIIEDFGSTHYLDLLNVESFKSLYKKAMDAIVLMQEGDASGLPLYDKVFLHEEMDLMKTWFLEKHLNLDLTTNEKEMIEQTLDRISDVVLQQPQELFVHRDFHSRNLLLTPTEEVGIIDFQDAMSGSITYDLVSLLKDCYIEYPKADIEALALNFRDKKNLDIDDATFIKWFDFMGMQRHIKVLGIFARLYLRDGKDGYLKDLPLTLKYTIDTALRYDETKVLGEYLSKLILPRV